MAAQAFDGEVGLAGIGGPKDGPHKGVTGHVCDVGMAAAKRKHCLCYWTPAYAGATGFQASRLNRS
jgi:hypothetical protein